MAELRFNPLTQDWVMIASHRQNRPQMPKDWCPFCPGSGKVPGAFTAVSDGQINVPIASDSTVYKACQDAMNGWDPTGGAIYYFNPDTATNKWIWSRTFIKQIGKHRFCK